MRSHAPSPWQRRLRVLGSGAGAGPGASAGGLTLYCPSNHPKVVHLTTGQPTGVIHNCGQHEIPGAAAWRICPLWPSDQAAHSELHGCKLLTLWINTVDNSRRRGRAARSGWLMPGGTPSGRSAAGAAGRPKRSAGAGAAVDPVVEPGKGTEDRGGSAALGPG